MILDGGSLPRAICPATDSDSKNRARKLFQRTLNPLHKSEANRLPAFIKRELKIHSQASWNAKLTALNTQNLANTKILTQKLSNIPNLNSSSGIASKDEQKANLITNTFEDNYMENKRPDDFKHNIDSNVTNTLEKLFSYPPPTPILPTNPEEICSYIKVFKNTKDPG
ncbi:hypothetical protein TNCV_4492751 [Trichonephila clavipes]|uniref:Uncharacterized protein n=1 Tax=Trichonephila clavipes TaxID=2585209 RepID=A0A8X6VE26_TRICX|nr:hypothetical protein TNCV_4492751 [Trichonephila clavipes]